MRVTFLGVGAALPAPGQTNCSYLIEAGGAAVLFDCGPCVLQQLAAAGRSPGEVTHLFVSHAHGDHALGWPMFLLWWALEGRDRGAANLPHVVGSDVTRRHLTALWEHSFKDAPALELPFTELPADRPATHRLAERISLRTWPMPHSTVAPVLGARFEVEGKVLSFTADTTRSPNVVPLAEGADLLVHDSRYGATLLPDNSSQAKFHASARDAGEYAESARARNLALVHIGAELAGREAELVAEARTRFTGNVFAPKGGDVFHP
jgi:ribonuclease Z